MNSEITVTENNEVLLADNQNDADQNNADQNNTENNEALLTVADQTNEDIIADDIITDDIKIKTLITQIDLTGKLSLKELALKINEIIAIVNELESNESSVSMRNRGPKSKRALTEEIAHRIMLGDHKDKPHKECAKEFGLSYGQVYSARFGHTFKPIYQQLSKLEVKPTWYKKP